MLAGLKETWPARWRSFRSECCILQPAHRVEWQSFPTFILTWDVPANAALILFLLVLRFTVGFTVDDFVPTYCFLTEMLALNLDFHRKSGKCHNYALDKDTTA